MEPIKVQGKSQNKCRSLSVSLSNFYGWLMEAEFNLRGGFAEFGKWRRGIRQMTHGAEVAYGIFKGE